MEVSVIELYQALKLPVLEILSLSKDAVHIHVGFLAFLLGRYLRGPRLSALLFPLGLSLIMEMLDAIADQRRSGVFYLGAHLHDLINTNGIPLVVQLISEQTWFRKRVGQGKLNSC